MAIQTPVRVLVSIFNNLAIKKDIKRFLYPLIKNVDDDDEEHKPLYYFGSDVCFAALQKPEKSLKVTRQVSGNVLQVDIYCSIWSPSQELFR